MLGVNTGVSLIRWSKQMKKVNGFRTSGEWVYLCVTVLDEVRLKTVILLLVQFKM